MDDFFASSVHGGPEVSIDSRHLLKVWRISYEDAKRTIDATTQHGTHHPNPVMNQNYTTNDWMLRYRRINQYFFMDTFFATKKGGTSSRGNTCCHLLFIERGLYMLCLCDRIPSTTPGPEPPRDAMDCGSARSHSTHLETSSSDRP